LKVIFEYYFSIPIKLFTFNVLIRDCIKILGQEAFQKVYVFLKDARFGEELRNEDSIMAGLGKIVKNPRDCFLVDQLLFMEKQAEIAAMT
jgi:hypothetical protein